MTMILADHHVRNIRDTLRESPLVEGEVRRVEGLGQLYMAISKNVPSVKGYKYVEQYKLNVDGIEVYFFARIPDQNLATGAS